MAISLKRKRPFAEHLPLLALGREIISSDMLSRFIRLLRDRSLKTLLVCNKENERDENELVADPLFGDTLYLSPSEVELLESGTISKAPFTLLEEHSGCKDIVLFQGDFSFCTDLSSLLSYEASSSGAMESRFSSLPCKDDIDFLVDVVFSWLERKLAAIPLWACILIGGKSSRMGQAKHLLRGENGKTWLENCVGLVSGKTNGIVLSGKGDVPQSIDSLARIEDIKGIGGPLAGVTAAMRSYPNVSWLLLACDMPDITEAGLDWLLNWRKPGVWGVVPYQKATGHYEPLLAYYDFRSRTIFEKIIASGCLRIGKIVEEEKISTPIIPLQYVHSWRNCNTPDDLKKRIDKE